MTKNKRFLLYDQVEQHKGVGGSAAKHIENIESASSFQELKEVRLEALMFEVADLANIPRTLEVSELFERLLEKGVITAEKYAEVARLLDH